MRSEKYCVCFYIIWCYVITVSLPQLLQPLFVLMNMLISVTLHVSLHLQLKAVSDNVWSQSSWIVLLVSFMFIEIVLILCSCCVCINPVVCFYLLLWSAFICEINSYTGIWFNTAAIALPRQRRLCPTRSGTTTFDRMRVGNRCSSPHAPLLFTPRRKVAVTHASKPTCELGITMHYCMHRTISLAIGAQNDRPTCTCWSHYDRVMSNTCNLRGKIGWKKWWPWVTSNCRRFICIAQ